MTLSLRDTNTALADRRSLMFRDVSWRGLVWGGLLFAFVAAYAMLPGETLLSRGVAVIPGATAVVLIGLGLVQRWLGGRRWLLAASRDGLYINLGYSEGYPVADAPSMALHLPYADIRAISQVTEVLRLPHRFGMTRHHLGSLDIVLDTPLPEEAVRLIAQRHQQLHRAGKSGPFPIRMISPTRLRLCWSAIKPNEAKAVRHLGQFSPTTPARRFVYPEWDALETRQRAIYLDDLWRMGMRAEALFLARVHFGVSSHEARALLERNGGATFE